MEELGNRGDHDVGNVKHINISKATDAVGNNQDDTILIGQTTQRLKKLRSEAGGCSDICITLPREGNLSCPAAPAGKQGSPSLSLSSFCITKARVPVFPAPRVLAHREDLHGPFHAPIKPEKVHAPGTRLTSLIDIGRHWSKSLVLVSEGALRRARQGPHSGPGTLIHRQGVGCCNHFLNRIKLWASSIIWRQCHAREDENPGPARRQMGRAKNHAAGWYTTGVDRRMQVISVGGDENH